MKLKVKTTSFEPINKIESDKHSFYGYLNQILEYEVTKDGEFING